MSDGSLTVDTSHAASQDQTPNREDGTESEHDIPQAFPKATLVKEISTEALAEVIVQDCVERGNERIDLS